MCVYKCAKYLLFAFNFCFWLAGAAVLGVAIWVLVDDDISDVVEVADISIYTGSYVLIVAGAVMLIVGFAGCCGAIKESTCLLGLYFACLFAIFALEVGAAIWAFLEFNSLQEGIDQALNETTTEQPIDIDDSYKTFQQNFKCCGTTTVCGGFDTKLYEGCTCTDSDDKVCGNLSSEQLKTCAAAPTGTKIYITPCSVALYDFLDDNMLLLAGIALGIGLAEVLGMVIAMCLCCKIKDKGDI